MKPRRLAVSLVAMVALSGGAARAVDCVVPGPATDLHADHHVFDGDVLKVEALGWTWPALDATQRQQVRLRSRVEYRDLASGPLAQFTGYNNFRAPSGGDAPLNQTTVYPFEMPVGDRSGVSPSNDGSILVPGHTYEFRVVVEYRYPLLGGCAQNQQDVNGSFSHESPPSGVLEIAIPAPPPPPPKNVVAVADTKRPLVTVTWDAPDGGVKPTEYVIRRRKVDPSSAKAFSDFVEVGRVKGKAPRKFIDRKVESDEVYEYVLDALLSGVAVTSIADAAYPSYKRCPKSKFDLWHGRWATTIGGDPGHNLSFDAASATDKPGTLRPHLNDDVGGLEIDAVAPGDMSGRLSWTAKATVVFPADGGVPAWAKDLVAGNGGTLKGGFDALPPLDPMAFRALEGRVKIRPPTLLPKVDRPFSAERIEATVSVPSETANLCATVAAGNTKPVKVGDAVIVLLQCVNLGPSPLYARRAGVDVVVENADLVEAAGGGWFEQVGALDAGGAHFKIGAIGPTKSGQSERATLALKLRATGAAGGQLRVTFRFPDDPTAPYAVEQPIYWKSDVRTVEIAIARPL